MLDLRLVTDTRLSQNLHNVHAISQHGIAQTAASLPRAQSSAPPRFVELLEGRNSATAVIQKTQVFGGYTQKSSDPGSADRPNPSRSSSRKQTGSMKDEASAWPKATFLIPAFGMLLNKPEHLHKIPRLKLQLPCACHVSRLPKWFSPLLLLPSWPPRTQARFQG